MRTSKHCALGKCACVKQEQQPCEQRGEDIMMSVQQQQRLCADRAAVRTHT